mmetsp:Transcript_29709/g.53897  ORF Transcript_29709/g.53897 Transcript_29709/m.53897 type:complete len:95 (+) Transcript_29709:71-355(+)
MLRHADRTVLCFLLIWQTWAQSPIPGEKHVYGKYFDSTGNDMDNSLYVWRPEGAPPDSPAVVYFHPGGSPARIHIPKATMSSTLGLTLALFTSP